MRLLFIIASDKTTRKTPDDIMDGFFKKVNQKVNVGRQGREVHNEESENCLPCM